MRSPETGQTRTESVSAAGVCAAASAVSWDPAAEPDAGFCACVFPALLRFAAGRGGLILRNFRAGCDGKGLLIQGFLLGNSAGHKQIAGDADCENAQEQDDVVAFLLKKFPEAVGFGMFIVLHGLHLLSLVLPRLWKHIPANERIILPRQARARARSSGPDSI